MSASLMGAQAPDNGLLPGLAATACDGQRQVVFAMPAPHFTLSGRESIHPQLQPNFKVEWEGYLEIPQDGQYAIGGSARIFLDGKELLGQPASLTAGPHALRMAFERNSAPARLQMQWQTDSLRSEPIPHTAFSHRARPKNRLGGTPLDRGRFLVEELNCLACHRWEGAPWTSWKGPSLSGIGARVKREWLYRWLQNPRQFQPNALMPVLLEAVQDRADVAVYLARLKAPLRKVLPAPAKEQPTQRGAELYQTIGCTACHEETRWPLAGLDSKYNAGALAAYLANPLSVDPSGRMPGLGLSSDESRLIAEYLSQSRNPEYEAPAPAGDAGRGKALVASSGCLNCHDLEEDGALVSTLTAPAFRQLDGRRGCGSERPAGNAARYSLGQADRDALRAFLERPDVSEAPLQDFERKLSQFGCLACHGLYTPAKAAFERFPPPLTESGQKLRASWLEQVLIRKRRIRPWLALRMPEFGEQNMRALIPGFAAQAGVEPGEGPILPRATPEQIEPGIKLIGRGEGGLSCISCHDFRGMRSPVEIRGPDMTEMNERLRADWTRRWLREPSRHLPGTPMPSFFSEMPDSLAEVMIDQLLNALGAGPRMPNPIGLPPVPKP